jgi:hypothetical protein
MIKNFFGVQLYDNIAHLLGILGVFAILTLPLVQVLPFDVPYLPDIYPIAEAVFIVLDLFLAVLFLYALSEGLKYRPHYDIGGKIARKVETLRTAYYRDRWEHIEKKYLASPTSELMRLAVIEADALVDRVLKDFGFPGEHLADRLQNLTTRDVKSLDSLWDAHRLRNELVHNPGFPLSVSDGKHALAEYKAFFEELQVF